MKKTIRAIILIIVLSVPQYLLSQNTAHDTISINNIAARINNNGNLFWDQVSNPEFLVPKNGQAGTIYNSTLWIAGQDTIDSLHVAAERYDQIGNDYWSGPVSNVYDTAYDQVWDKTWKITKAEIDDFIQHWYNVGYNVPPSITSWPAHGNPLLGQAYFLAPFYDRGGDGNYDPTDGDYPLIKGDEAVLFIYNDDRYMHTESGGNKLKLDIIGMAYQFNCNSDSALQNTIFLNYKIYNRSSEIYDSTYIGVFTDMDIGSSLDDYVGCDVERGTYFGYNSSNTDGTGQPGSYGSQPPAQGITFLAGPYMDPDALDNANGNCDAGVNGINFGNGFVDDERLGMTGFVYFNNNSMGAPAYSTDPLTADEYYSYLTGYWKDSIQMEYGGNAHTGAGAYGPACNFMFPGNSDSCNWGTGGMPPNGAVYWTETTAGNQPDERRGLGISGPFTFEPGTMKEIDLAYVFGNAYAGSADSSVSIMLQRVDSIRKYFINDSTPCGGGFSNIDPIKVPGIRDVRIYPNPATSSLYIELPEQYTRSVFSIRDITGNRIKQGTFYSNKNTLDISELSQGLYLLSIENGKEKVSKKFIRQ